MTTKSFQQQVPNALAAEGALFWRAVVLGLHTPWYLLTYRRSLEVGGGVIETLAVDWERTLSEVIEAAGSSAVMAIARIVPASDGGRFAWTLKQVREVMLPAKDESEGTGPLLFVFADRPGVHDCNESLVHEKKDGRKTLWSLGPD